MEMESTTKTTKPQGDDSDLNCDDDGDADRESSMGNNYKYCFFFARKFGSSVLQPPADVKESFAAYSGGATQMTTVQLQRFLIEVQGDSGVTLADTERIVEQLRRRHEVVKLGSKPGIDLEDFLHFLMSAELNPPIRSEVHQDMTAPLSHYYIYTGHNSYLTGNQLSSDCSERPIIKALQRGVRVIELDMWPNSAKDNVHVLHGRTLTSPVDMIRCLQSIKEFAFCASSYPVVITLEDHLTSELQAKVAEMVTRTFGDMLFYPSSEYLKEFPSPDDLKNRIIISTKPPKEYLESKNTKDKEDGDQKAKKSKEEEAWGNDVANLKTSHDKDVHKSCSQDQYDEDPDDDDEEEEEEDESQNSAPEYRRIITVHAGKPKGRMSDALKVDPEKVRRLSLSEKKLAKAAESHGAELVRFTQRNVLRVYPKGTRFNSSNYNPLISWMYGVQMVAFNMQGYGRSLWLMQGLFRANGGCGYVKKPDFLLKKGQHGEVFYPERSLPVRKTLKVKVYMGDGWRMDFSKTHFDTFSPPDFYVRVGIAGVPADCVMKKTRIKEDEWVPVWDEEFSFLLTVPELALLRVEVHEYDRSEKDDFGGQTCLPVWELRAGMRAVPLYDRKGNKYKSVRLLMRFVFV